MIRAGQCHHTRRRYALLYSVLLFLNECGHCCREGFGGAPHCGIRALVHPDSKTVRISKKHECRHGNQGKFLPVLDHRHQHGPARRIPKLPHRAGGGRLPLLTQFGLWKSEAVHPLIVSLQRAETGLVCLAGSGRLLTASPTAAKWLGVAIFTAAGVYQLTAWKDWCLRRCRSPIGALMYYLGFKGRSRDLRVGLHHGTTCAGCCWGLMIVLIAVGVMNVSVMAALAVVIFTEKLWRYGKPFGQAVGVALVAFGVLAIWFPWLLPGLHVSGMPAMPAM